MAKKKKIDVLVSPSEAQYERFQALLDVVEKSDKFNEPTSDENIEFDLLFQLDDLKFGVECKEIADWHASISGGHLGNQLLTHIEAPFPTWIVIFGSQDEVESEVPDYGRDGFNDWKAKIKKVNQQMGFKGDCEGLFIDVRFHSKKHKSTYRYILSGADNYLLGPSITSWVKPRGDLDSIEREMAALGVWVKGIGDEKARALVDHYGGIVPMCIQLSRLPSFESRVNDILKVKVNGRSIGKNVANDLVYALGKRGWAEA